MRRATAILAIVTAALSAPAIAHAQNVFDSGTRGSPGFALFPFWQQVLSDETAAIPQQGMAPVTQPPAAGAAPVIMIPAAYPGSAQISPPMPGCADARRCLPTSWLRFLDGLRGKTRREQLDAVNQWANAKPYIEDIVNWGVADYWETPAEFIAHGGDCEDFAIAKYFSLSRLGFAASDLRIVIVDDTNLNAFHAVLAVRLNGQTLLLDNQIPQIVPMDIAVQYRPVYSLNADGWWIHTLPKLTVSTVTVTASGSAREGW